MGGRRVWGVERGLVGVTLVSWSEQTAALPGLLWLTHTPRSDSLTAWGLRLQWGEWENISFPALRNRSSSTPANRRGRKERWGGGAVLRVTARKTFASQKVSTTVPCQPIKDVRLASQGLLKPYVQKNFSAGKTFQILSKSQRLWC